MTHKEAHTTPSIQVIERMFALIDALAAHQDPVPLKVLSERTGLHPSTAHRILNDLAVGRFVDRPEAGSYPVRNWRSKGHLAPLMRPHKVPRHPGLPGEEHRGFPAPLPLSPFYPPDQIG